MRINIYCLMDDYFKTRVGDPEFNREDFKFMGPAGMLALLSGHGNVAIVYYKECKPFTLKREYIRWATVQEHEAFDKELAATTPVVEEAKAPPPPPPAPVFRDDLPAPVEKRAAPKKKIKFNHTSPGLF